MLQTTTLGQQYAHALADKDAARLGELLRPDIDFRALTPNRVWNAATRDDALAILLRNWFEDTDEIRSVESIESGVVADRERVGYRFRVENPEGRFLVEQQAYLAEQNGGIAWMRVMCSGYRPL